MILLKQNMSSSGNIRAIASLYSTFCLEICNFLRLDRIRISEISSVKQFNQAARFRIASIQSKHWIIFSSINIAKLPALVILQAPEFVHLGNLIPVRSALSVRGIHCGIRIMAILVRALCGNLSCSGTLMISGRWAILVDAELFRVDIGYTNS